MVRWLVYVLDSLPLCAFFSHCGSLRVTAFILSVGSLNRYAILLVQDSLSLVAIFLSGGSLIGNMLFSRTAVRFTAMLYLLLLTHSSSMR